MTITEFLLARIAEDEAYAREPAGWNEYNPGDPGEPKRVLAECQSKRVIISRAVSWIEDFTDDGTYSLRMAQAIYSDLLRLLAEQYYQHPDFDEAWRLL